MKSKHRILLTGGGTGGHIHPALAVGETLLQLEPNAQITYAGSGLPEREMVPKTMKYVEFRAIGLTKIYGFQFLNFLFNLSIGTLQAFWYCLRFRPTAIFSTGGYVSAPSVLAAIMISKLKLIGRKIPIVLFEPNAEPGRLNQLIHRFVVRTSVASEYAKNLFQGDNVFVDGYPIRWNLEKIPKQIACQMLRIPEDAIVILAFGGSMGARSLNRAMIEVWKKVRMIENVVLLLAVGKKKTDLFDPMLEAKQLLRNLDLADDPRLHIVETFTDMSVPYSAADIVVARAGAGTISEICQFGKAAILVPKANVPLDHQAVNAFSMQLEKKAKVVYEKVVLVDQQIETIVPSDTLYQEIKELIENPRIRTELSQNASSNSQVNSKYEIAKKLLFYSSGGKETNLQKRHSLNKSHQILPIGLNPLALRVHFENELQKHSISWKWLDLLPDKVLQKVFTPIPSVELIRTIPFYDYYCYRANTMLGNGRWEVQNEGIKLSALCLYDEVLPILLQWIQDRRPTSWLKRKLGGDFQTVGFLRRNATAAIPSFKIWSDEVVDALLFALSDPYWEVRTAATRTLARFPTKNQNYERVLAAIEKTISFEKHYEVLSAAWIAYGYLLDKKPKEILVHRDLIHPNDLVRTALLFSIELLIQKGVQFGTEELKSILDQVLMTTSQFTPNFGLRMAIANFQKSIAEYQCSIG